MCNVFKEIRLLYPVTKLERPTENISILYFEDKAMLRESEIYMYVESYNKKRYMFDTEEKAIEFIRKKKKPKPVRKHKKEMELVI